MTSPPAEVQMDARSVRALLQAERPELAGRPIVSVDEGWDNFTFRLGEWHAVRLPRREAAVPLLLNEQRWLPLLAQRLPLAAPVPLHAGRPGPGFAWPWSVVRWVGGVTAENHRFQSGDGTVLAKALLALHRPAPSKAPANPFRGVPLETRHDAVQRRLSLLKSHPGVDAEKLSAIWRRARSLPAATERRWLHGDLHPRNVVVRDGAPAGLIDWGDLCGGDVATDLACAWTLFDSPAVRAEFLKAYGATEPETQRASGWAVNLGLALAESGQPRYVEIGLATLERVASEL